MPDNVIESLLAPQNATQVELLAIDPSPPLTLSQVGERDGAHPTPTFANCCC